MSGQLSNIDGLLEFIRQYRSNEVNFEKLYAKSRETNQESGARLSDLEEAADVYRKAKEETGSAWPEFENFVSQFEKRLIQLKKH